MLPLFRPHIFVPSPLSGWKAAYLGDSIGDKWNPVGGNTQGKWQLTLDALWGLTHVAQGISAFDYVRGSISGRLLSASALTHVGAQPLAAESNVVAACLAKLPDIVFLELGTNDWANVSNTFTPAVFGASIDVVLAALTANTAVKSVQAAVPSAALGGNYTLLWGTAVSASILATDTVATISTKLAAASNGGIPFVAGTWGDPAIPPLSNGVPLELTANSAGANAQVVIGTNAVTGGTLTMSVDGLGGTPAVKQIVMVGMGNHSTDTPSGGLPSWATSLADCFWQMEMTMRAKAQKWNGTNGIPITYVPMTDMPNLSTFFTVDHTHPTDPMGQSQYSDRVIHALTMGA